MHFTDIVDLDSGRPHETSRIDFENVAVGSDGGFTGGSPGSNIDGNFTAGVDPTVAVGTFESDGIVGAFGAARE